MEKNRFAATDEFCIDIGIDGVPLTKSSNSQLWPILGTIFPSEEVFVIGIFYGLKKPYCANIYLKKFVEQIKEISRDGFVFENKIYNV